MASAPSAKYFNSTSRLTLSKKPIACATKTGPEEISGTTPMRIFVRGSCARARAKDAETSPVAALAARTRRRVNETGILSPFGTHRNQLHADSATAAPTLATRERGNPGSRHEPGLKEDRRLRIFIEIALADHDQYAGVRSQAEARGLFPQGISQSRDPRATRWRRPRS